MVSLDISIGNHSDEKPALGGHAVSDMSSMLVAQLAVRELLTGHGTTNTPASREWAVAALVANWAIAQLQENAVTIRSARNAETFIRMADGSFNSQPQKASLLSTVNNNYILTGRLGTVTTFNSANKLASISDIDGNFVTFTYIADKLDRLLRRFE